MPGRRQMAARVDMLIGAPVLRRLVGLAAIRRRRFTMPPPRTGRRGRFRDAEGRVERADSAFTSWKRGCAAGPHAARVLR
ncbi:hypothetical protein CFP66_02615 [Pseudonocardia sp. MH-G8]|nr:hypothetical protein CFP66_02615 [Pseudonocardia sp. MH-G8]